MEENQERINELGNAIIDLIESFGDLPPYEIGHQLISNATSMLLCLAPNELVGVKTILSCVECGIASYEETHS
jgi:hypothetical protein